MNSLLQRPIIDGQSFRFYYQLKDDVSCCLKIDHPEYRSNFQNDRGFQKTINLRQLPTLSVASCDNIRNKAKRDYFLLAIMWMIVTNNKQSDDCSRNYGFDAVIKEVCNLHQRNIANLTKEELRGYMRQGN